MSYNGWTDYPTWRIKTDLLDNIEFTEPVTADYILEIAEEIVFDNYEMKQGSHHVEDYARVFLAMANYQEIADTINEDIKINEHLTNKT